MSKPRLEKADFTPIETFYDQTYYKNAGRVDSVSRHYQKLANRLNIRAGDNILDIACGTGEWLLAAHERQASVTGIDISNRAIALCRTSIPEGRFEIGPAERLPFEDNSFDLITCLGSLEHFLDKDAAITEMLRVGKPGAGYVILVPNAGFLTRRLGLFRGTEQRAIKEDVLDLKQWTSLFEKNGLTVIQRWADLHVLSLAWITKSAPYWWPLRLTQAVSLAIWPLDWQYQVFHLCRKSR